MEKNIMVAVFKVESEGYQALTELRQAAATDDYLVSAAALVKKDKDGCEYLDGFDTGADTVNDTVIGGLVGMLAGVLAGPVGMLLGGSYGALIGMSVDTVDTAFGASMLEQIANKLDDGMVALIGLTDEVSEAELDAKLAKYDVVVARFDEEAVAEEVNRACEMQEEMARQARMELRKERKAEAVDSAKQGAANFLDDAKRVRDSVGEISADRKEAKAAGKAERKVKFDSAVSELKESFGLGAEKSGEDGAVLMESLKEIAEDAGIDVKEDSAVAEAFNALKESFAQGVEAFKADASVTKEAFEELSDERKAEKEAKIAERSRKLDETIEAMKKSLE